MERDIYKRANTVATFSGLGGFTQNAEMKEQLPK